jgi:hypothetical protein
MRGVCPHYMKGEHSTAKPNYGCPCEEAGDRCVSLDIVNEILGR